MGALVRDLRFARRSLLRAPGVTLAAALSLTLAIGGTTTVFSIVNAALLRPPPFAAPDRLTILYLTRQRGSEPPHRTRWSWPRFRLLERSLASYEAVASFSRAQVLLTGDESESVETEIVSASYFPTLRVSALSGRTFTPDEDSGIGDHPVVVLGHDLWERRFGGDQNLVGRTIALNGLALTVIGVLPPGFAGVTGRAQLWIPVSMAPRLTYGDYTITNQDFISVIGRLRGGVPLERAMRELAIVGPRIERIAPSSDEMGDTRFSATALPLNEARIDPLTRRPAFLLLAATGVFLLLACANVAILLLGRAVRRRREMAIRVAVGAGRLRLVRQLLVEHALLAVVATGGGLLLSVWLAALLPLPSAIGRGRNFYGAVGEFANPQLDLRVALFAACVGAVATLIFGLAPALRATRVDVVTDLKSGGGGGVIGGGRHVELRHALLVVDVALALVLLAGGGLLLASYRRIQGTSLGFDRGHLLTFMLRPPEVQYPPARAPALIDRALAAIERVPGVQSATVDACAPLGQCANSTLYIVGQPVPPPDQAPPVLRHYVAPDHFRTLGIPLLRGRPFTARDRAGSPRVAIINAEAARRFWPGRDPIGQRVWFGGGSSFDRPDSSAEIVGIVGDVPYQPLDSDPLQPDFFTPYAQFTYVTRMVIVRTQGDPLAVVPALRAALHTADASLTPTDVRTMEQRIGDSWSRQSYQTMLLDAFAAAALLVAVLGVYAVTAHLVAERRREIAIRMALGARARDVVVAVTRRGMLLVVLGAGAGVVASAGVSRVLAALLYQTSPLDPLVFGAVVAIVLAVAAAASWFPARRAVRVRPVEALRAD